MPAKVVALAGASGYVGKAFVDAFLKLNAFQVRLLVRSESIDTAPYQDYKKRGASLHAISYDDEASLVKALDGVDVLVSSVAATALTSAQIPLVKASKKAGVKVFFPSEYGGHFPEDTPSPILRQKKEVVKSAQEHGLPVAILNNGGFPEYISIPHNMGRGEHQDLMDDCKISRKLANVLKSVPVLQLQNKDISIEGSSSTLNEIVELWERKHNDKLQVQHRSLKELDDRIGADPNDFLAILLRGFDAGHACVGGKDNVLYPNWKPDSVESIL
ncbi:hypothetical protein RhiTH_002748 [Rhizoctonia solani]